MTKKNNEGELIILGVVGIIGLILYSKYKKSDNHNLAVKKLTDSPGNTLFRKIV